MKTTCFTSLPAILLAISIVSHPCAAHAASAPTSELIEKGIYAEETKGDLDAAIAIYQQAVLEAKTSLSLAAQAQLRLGLCLLKKNRTAEAATAFEKVIRDYPGEKEWVAKAREHLPSEVVLRPAMWVDGERLQLMLTLAAGTEIGSIETRADLVEANGKKVWRLGRRMSGGGEMVSSVDVDLETFRPATSYWKHTLLGEVSAAFRAGEVELQKAGSPDSTNLPLEKSVFDNEQCFHLLRQLPYQVGYKATLPVIITLGGGAVIPLGVEVLKKETLQVPAGKFDCFKVQLSIGQTFWISDDANRYPVKFEGAGAIGQLTSISQRKAGQPVAFRDDTLGTSFTAPADWFVCRFASQNNGKQILIRTYDANADADDGGLRLFATDSLAAGSRQSPRAWAEQHLSGNKEIKVRADSWKNLNVSGRLAVSCVADGMDGGNPRVKFLIYALGGTYSEFFVISAAPEKFDALKAAFETILASYRTTR